MSNVGALPLPLIPQILKGLSEPLTEPGRGRRCGRRLSKFSLLNKMQLAGFAGCAGGIDIGYWITSYEHVRIHSIDAICWVARGPPADARKIVPLPVVVESAFFIPLLPRIPVPFHRH